MRDRAYATLRLRGREGRVHADVAWPADDPAAMLVFLGEAHSELICRALGNAIGAVTLTASHVGAQDAIALLEWAADHTGDLGDPERLILGGLQAGASRAASLALRARDAGWPAIDCQLLIHPHLPQLPRSSALAGVAPAVIAGAGTESARARPPAPMIRAHGASYVDRLLAAGIPVIALDRPNPFTQRVPGEAARQQLAELAAAAQSLTDRTPVA
jgi:acetyl esterase